MTEKLSTSLKIDPDVWKKAKVAAINKDMQVGEYVAQAISEKIKREEKKLATAQA